MSNKKKYYSWKDIGSEFRSAELPAALVFSQLKKLDKNIIPIKRQNHYDFFQALKSDKISIIAEVKFKSPSEGLIYKNIDPLKIALEYQNAGADAISIISDSKSTKL